VELTTVDSFVAYYERIQQRTRRVVECIQPGAIEWTYREGRFTLGDLVRHLAAIERWMWAENVCGRPGRYPGHGRELADGYEEVLEYFDKMQSETRGIISTLREEDLRKKCNTPGGSEITAWKWLRAMIEHHVHHRGQIYTYLSMLNIPTPPLYGLTSEEVREHSKDD